MKNLPAQVLRHLVIILRVLETSLKHVIAQHIVNVQGVHTP